MTKVTDTSRKYANQPKNQTMLHIRKDLVIKFCLLPGGRNCSNSSSSSPGCSSYQSSSSTWYTKAKTDKLMQDDRTKYYVKNNIVYFRSHTIFTLKTTEMLI